MKKILLSLILMTLCSMAFSQEQSSRRLSFSTHGIVQAFKVPFARPAVYFRNKGWNFATIYNIGGKSTFQQSFEFAWYFNQYHGSTYMLSTGISYNPIHSESLTAGLSIGAGYMNSGFSSGGWEQNKHGEWVSSSNRIGNIFIPADIHIRFKIYENEKILLSPCLGYQFNALIRYSHASFLLPQSSFKAGLNIRLKKS